MVEVLKPFQRKGSDWLFQRKRALLADQMRLGKTPQAIRAFEQIEPPLKRILIVAPGNAQHVWLSELKKWGSKYAQEFKLVRGQASKRAGLWKTAQFVICTYGVLKQDFKSNVLLLGWDLVIADEVHGSGAANRKRKGYEALKALDTKHFYMLTGTPPVGKGPQQMWGLLNILHPYMYPSYWRFVNTFCLQDVNEWGGREIIGVKNIHVLKEQLKPIVLRRTKKEVAPELPTIQRQVIPIDMSADQQKMYSLLLNDMSAVVYRISDVDVEVDEPLEPGDEGTITPTSLVITDILAQMMRLRQMLVCPKMLDPQLDYGNGIETIIEMLEGYEREDQHIVIFTPFTKAFEHLSERLYQAGMGPVYMLKGGMKSEDVALAIKKFTASKGIMICSIKYAQAFSLASASVCFFLGYEWDPNENYQAESRLDTIMGNNAVMAYYLMYKDSVDERVFEVLNTKQTNINTIFGHRNLNAIKELIGPT